MSLSAYELQRLENIKSNEAKLTALGLNERVVPLKKPAAPRKRKVDEDPEYKPVPRQTRARTGTGVGQRAAANVSDDDGSDNESDDDYSDEDDEPKVTTSRKKQRAKPTTPSPVVAKDDDDGDDDDESKCVVVEAAKTGRSKCRGCMEPIDQGELRVGMQSWMVGRQVVVWQHPKCFLSQVAAATQAGGKRKCKATKQTFSVGERSIALTAHTTTNHVKLAAAGELLAPVLTAAAAQSQSKAKSAGPPPTVDALRSAAAAPETFDALDAADLAALQAGLAKGCGGAAAAVEVGETPSTSEAMASEQEDGAGAAGAKSAGGKKSRRQPAAGSVSKAKGKVCWKWAGALCYGTLIANSETTSHCYAKTQRGNTKTLTKGGSYWWIL